MRYWGGCSNKPTNKGVIKTKKKRYKYMLQENTPAKVGLLELLLASSGVQFVIPAYQRNYIELIRIEPKS